MGAAVITGVAGLRKELMAAVKEVERQGAAEVERAAWVVLEGLLSWTPVWEGQVLRSYTVSIDSPVTANRQPLGTGDPGPTNSMALGDEPRRGPNEAAVRSEAAGALRALSRGLRTVWVTNGSDLWDLVDSGGAPGGPGQQIRNPGGTSKLALQRARGILGDTFR